MLSLSTFDPPMSWPAPPFDWETLRYIPGAESAVESKRYENVLAQWKHYEPYFQSQGYTLLWPDVESIRNLQLWKPSNLPHASDPFHPGPGEDFVAMPFGHGTGYDSYNHFSIRGAVDSQGRCVIIKVPRKKDGYDELDVVEFLRQSAERRDPRDHCLPILDVLVAGQTNFMIMPVWSISVMWGPFWNIAEVLDCFEQLLTDIHAFNTYISLDGIGPINERRLIHFRHKYPLKYAYADYGLASRFPLDAPLESCKVVGLHGAHQGPEQSNDVPYNAFALDVYQLGQTFHRLLWNNENTTLPAELRAHVPQLHRLMSSMVSRDPSRRPTVDQALQRLKHIQGSLDSETLDIRAEFLDPDEMMPNIMKGNHQAPEPAY